MNKLKNLKKESYETKTNADKKLKSLNDLSAVTKKETKPCTLTA